MTKSCSLDNSKEEIKNQLKNHNRKSIMGFKRRDIIWARVHFPQKWWPGLVLSIHGHWVAVSFFNDMKRNRRYFLETEVCSFEENFEPLVKTLKDSSKGGKLLDSALKFIATRVISSLKCSCHFFPPRKDGEISKRIEKDLFQSGLVLGFVLDLAVSPFIEVSDLVYAVTMAAKINAFRRYVGGACSAAQETDVSELESEPSNEDQPQPDCMSVIETEHTKPQSLREMLVILRCLALGTMCLSKNCLNIVKQNVMMFRSLASRSSLNPTVKICSLSSSSHPWYIAGQPNFRDAGNSCQDALGPFKPYVERSNEFMGLKWQYDHPIGPGSSFKLCKTVTFLSITEAYTFLQKDKIAEGVCILDALISKPVVSDSSLKFFSRTDACQHTKRIKCEANISGIQALSSVSKLEVVMTSKATTGTRNCLPSPDTTDQIQMELSKDDYTISVKTNADIRMDNEKQHQLVTSDVTFKREVEVEQQPALGSLFDSRYLHMKFPRDFSNLPSKKDLIRKFSRFGKVDSFRTKIFARLGSAQVVFLHHLDAVTAYQFAKRKKILLGEAKMLFWLGPCAKNGRSKSVIPSPKLRSCLKKSGRKHGREDKMQAKRVRFLMETNERT